MQTLSGGLPVSQNLYGILCIVGMLAGLFLAYPQYRVARHRWQEIRAEAAPMRSELPNKVWPLIFTVVVCLCLGAIGVLLLVHHPVPKVVAVTQGPPPPTKPTSVPEQPSKPGSPIPKKSAARHRVIHQDGHDNQQTANQGSITQNNSGGINVQQGTTGDNSPILNSPINVNADRRLTGPIPARRSPQGTVWISTLGDSEEVDLAVHLQVALINAGWDAQLGARMMIIAGTCRGIEVGSNGESQASSEIISDLHQQGLEAHSAPLRNRQFTPIAILICGRP